MRTCSGMAAPAWAICACATCCAFAATAVNVRKDADPIRVAKRDVVGFMLIPPQVTGASSRFDESWWSLRKPPPKWANQLGTPLDREMLAQAERELYPVVIWFRQYV